MSEITYGPPISPGVISGGTATLRWANDVVTWEENPLITWVRVEPPDPASAAVGEVDG